jgi:hypothetical protein
VPAPTSVASNANGSKAVIRSESRILKRLEPSIISAIRSLGDGKRTLWKPYATSSIYGYVRAPKKGRTALPSVNFRHPTLNFQHPAKPLGQLADRIVAFLRERRDDHQALITWRKRNRQALREFWACAPDALGVKQELEKALTQDSKPPK